MRQTALGRKIQQLRQERGLTLRDLARKAQVDERGLGRIESGDSPAPYFPTVQRIARALGVDLNTLDVE